MAKKRADQAGSSRWLGAGLLVAAVGGYWWYRRHNAALGAGAGAGAGADAGQATGTYTVAVAATPSSAVFALDGAVIGTGTINGALARNGVTHTLVVSAPGYVDQTITFVDASPPTQVTLQAVPASPRTVPPFRTAPVRGTPSVGAPLPVDLTDGTRVQLPPGTTLALDADYSAPLGAVTLPLPAGSTITLPDGGPARVGGTVHATLRAGVVTLPAGTRIYPTALTFVGALQMTGATQGATADGTRFDLPTGMSTETTTSVAVTVG